MPCAQWVRFSHTYPSLPHVRRSCKKPHGRAYTTIHPTMRDISTSTQAPKTSAEPQPLTLGLFEGQLQLLLLQLRCTLTLLQLLQQAASSLPRLQDPCLMLLLLLGREGLVHARQGCCLLLLLVLLQQGLAGGAGIARGALEAGGAV